VSATRLTVAGMGHTMTKDPNATPLASLFEEQMLAFLREHV
jgi:hypothetical protein